MELVPAGGCTLEVVELFVLTSAEGGVPARRAQPAPSGPLGSHATRIAGSATEAANAVPRGPRWAGQAESDSRPHRDDHRDDARRRQRQQPELLDVAAGADGVGTATAAQIGQP